MDYFSTFPEPNILPKIVLVILKQRPAHIIYGIFLWDKNLNGDKVIGSGWLLWPMRATPNTFLIYPVLKQMAFLTLVAV